RVTHQSLAASGISAMWSEGRYAFLQSAVRPGGTLLDERSGRSIRIQRPGCGIIAGQGARSANPLGGGWLLLNCGTNQVPKPTLYSITTKTWLTVTVNRLLDQPNCAISDSTCGGFPIAVGARWIEFYITCYHCGDTYVFQNIRTGSLAREPRPPRP